jgi:regulator of RNase E activity RraA
MHDDELFATLSERLFPAVVGDVLDTMGFRHQFLPPSIQPLADDMILAGRAMPVVEEDMGAEDSGAPFGLMFRALDDLRRHEVYLATGASPTYALWGELMTLRARQCGAAGAVLNGYARDTKGILAQGFPVFAMGRYAQDQAPRGRVTEFRVAVKIGAVEIRPGDILFGDLDGLLVIPREAEEEVIARALEKASQENLVRRAIENGMTAEQAFREFGVM